MFFLHKITHKRNAIKYGIILLMMLIIIQDNTIATEEPSLYATAAVLMDADSGRILVGKNQDMFLANASTTKILTCILILENASEEDLVEVSSYAASMPKVKLYMKKGEHFKLGDLLYSLMLESHNDTAVALAEHVAGDIEHFSAMMNQKAAEIGCCYSCFLTPNGLDATRASTQELSYLDQLDGSLDGNLSHGTTAKDLAKIMAYCTFQSDKAERFLEITRTKEYSFYSEEGRAFHCTNHNAFLTMMDGALSGKTGFTNKAGYCYVGALEQNDKRFVIALLGCGWPNNKSYKWSDSKTLFSYGIKNYNYKNFDDLKFDKTKITDVYVKNAQTDRIEQYLYCKPRIIQSDYKGLLLSGEEEIDIVISMVNEVEAPLLKITEVGSVKYYLNKECLREDRIVIEGSVLKIDYLWSLRRIIDLLLL